MDQVTKILGEVFKDYMPLKFESDVNVCVLAAKMGEVAKIVVEKSDLPSGSNHLRKMYNESLRHELVHLAAISVAAIESLDINELRISEENKNATQAVKY
jgi:hypothetical protein